MAPACGPATSRVGRPGTMCGRSRLWRRPYRTLLRLADDARAYRIIKKFRARCRFERAPFDLPWKTDDGGEAVESRKSRSRVRRMLWREKTIRDSRKIRWPG